MLKKYVIILLLPVILLTACAKASPFTPEEEQGIASDVNHLVDGKGDWWKALELYKKLTQFQEKDSPDRKKTLRYLLDQSLEKIQERKADEGLQMAKAMNEVIPNDYYIQNRMLSAYRIMAEDAMAKKEWEKAYDLLYNTALKLRFDNEVMRTYLKLETLKAVDAITAKKYADAKTLLDEVTAIADIQENKQLYPKEKAAAEELMKKLPKDIQKQPAAETPSVNL